MTARLLLGLRTQVARWADGFDPGVKSARFWGLTLLATCGWALVLIAALVWLAPLRSFFGLRPAVPLAVLALRAACFAALFLVDRLVRLGSAFFVVTALAMGSLFQLAISSMVVFSDPPGAFVLAVIAVIVAVYNCIFLRSTPAFPWPAIGHGVAMAIALALHPVSPQIEIFSVVGPLGCGAGLFLGGIAETAARQRRLLEEHRRAIEIEAFAESSGEARKLSSTLLEILQSFHDASSALSTVLLEADLLGNLLKRGEKSAPAEVEAARLALREGLRRVGVLLGEAETSPEAPPAPGVARVLAAVRAAVERVGRRFPATRIALRSPSARAPEADAALRGGGDALEQLVAELLKNACEGDGARRAATVEVEIDADGDPGAVWIRVADDGPGLPAHLQGSPPAALVSTKPDGSGLGLYIVERTVARSGGCLRLENAASGGACVSIRLAVAGAF